MACGCKLVRACVDDGDWARGRIGQFFCVYDVTWRRQSSRRRARLINQRARARRAEGALKHARLWVREHVCALVHHRGARKRRAGAASGVVKTLICLHGHTVAFARWILLVRDVPTEVRR